MSNIPHVSPIDIDDPLGPTPDARQRKQPHKSVPPAASGHDQESSVLTAAPSLAATPERLERHPEANFSVRVPAQLTRHLAIARAQLTATHGTVSVAELGAAILAEHFRDLPRPEILERLGELLERYRDS